MKNIIEALGKMKEIVRARAEDYLRSIDRVIELYRTDALPADAQYLSQAISQAPQPEDVPPESPAVKPAKRTKKPAARPAPAPRKASPRASSSVEGPSMFAQAADAVGRMQEPFGAADLAAAVPGLRQILASGYLDRMIKGGVVKRVGHGKYARVGKGRVATAAAPQAAAAAVPEPAVTPERTPNGNGFTIQRSEPKPNSLLAAIIEVAGRSPEPFTLQSLLPQILAHPNARTSPEERTRVNSAAYLQELRGRGWLDRVGTERPTAFRRTSSFVSTAGHSNAPGDRYDHLGTPATVEETEEQAPIKQR